MSGRWTVALRVAGAAAVALVVLFLAGLLPYGIVRVGMDSMSPTLDDGDRVLVEHTSAGIRHADLVVVTAPDGSGAVLKRVAAVGGDRVAIEDGVLVVNGAAVVEPWFDRTRIDGEYAGPISVPPGTVWVLGDNRGESVDSRSFGPVGVDSVVGRVTARLWPAPRGF